MTVENSLRADAWALKKLGEYQSGKVILWSWVSRGLLSMEHVAEWYYNNDVSAATAALSGTPGEMRKLCDIDEIPHVDASKEQKEIEDAQQNPLSDIHCAWALQDPADSSKPPIPLPNWFRAPIDKAILLWQAEARKWDQKITERQLQGKETLPPKSQQAYEAWAASKTRSLVLDKTKQAVVVNIASKSIASLKKHCVLVVIHMGREAEELRIRSGSGKLWKLQLLQFSKKPVEDVPKEIDDFQEGLQYITGQHWWVCDGK